MRETKPTPGLFGDADVLTSAQVPKRQFDAEAPETPPASSPKKPAPELMEGFARTFRAVGKRENNFAMYRLAKRCVDYAKRLREEG
jgi:hypothetical protein